MQSGFQSDFSFLFFFSIEWPARLARRMDRFQTSRCRNILANNRGDVLNFPSPDPVQPSSPFAIAPQGG